MRRTGLGLAVAALVPYDYFLARADRTLDEIEGQGTRLELILTGLGASRGEDRAAWSRSLPARGPRRAV